MSSIMKGLVDEQDIEETKKLSAQEKFKRSMKRAGYDMDAGAKRLQDLLDKQKKEREELEKKELKDVSEDATLQFAAEVTPTVNPYAGIKDRKFRGAIGEGIKRMFEEPNYSPTDAGYQEGGWRKLSEEELDENLRKWFKEKWVRFGPDGKIRGACARGSSSEGKPKCLPQAKAHALGKKGRKYAAAKKRREDPNPERSGPAKNVATKKKSKSESIDEGLWDWIKDKLSNKKPIQWSENYYDFIIRNDPTYLQTYLNAVKNDPNYIEWKKNNPNKPQQSTSQTNYASSQNRPNQSGSFDDFTAPHGSSENEFKMFVNGQKPAAIVPEPNFSTWAKVINSGKYWTKQLFYNGRLHSVIIVQPGNEQSGQQIYELVQNAMKLAEKGDFRAYQNSNYHRRLGKLLGYPKDKVEQFINNYFKDREDLAKIKIDEQGVAEGFMGNVKDTELKNIDPDNHNKGEGDFVKNQLHTIKRVVTHLENSIGNEEDLPDWVQSEIAKATDKIVNVMDYSISKKEQDIGSDSLMKEQGVTEAATVTRIDSKPITDFSSGLKAYKHTDDWSQSGLETGDDSYWKNKNLKTNTTKGLFAGDPHRTALYATGNAHETRYVEFTQNGQPIVYFDKKDLPAIRSRETYLTVFDASNFKKLPTGEWFSENPGKPIKQTPIGDPFKYIADQGWIIRVTDDLDKVFNQVQKMHKAGKIDHYGAEGMNESKSGVAEGSGKNVVKSIKVGNFRHDLVDTGMGWQVRIYNGDELYDTGMSKNSEQKGLAALEDAVAYTEKQTRTKRQGVAEGYSDMSGLLSASNLNNSYIITAELAEGGKKKFRVKAQSERVAIEKFKKHHSMAKIINVEEEGVKEGSKYPRNPASYHLKKYPVPQDQMAKPVKKEPKKPEQKPEEKVDEGKRIPRKPGQPANSKKHSDLYTDENPKGTIHGLKFATAEDARASVSKIRNSGRSHAHKIQAAVAMEQRAKAAGKAEAASVYRKFINSMKKKTDESQIDEACWKGYHKEGMKTMFGKKYPNCVKNKKKTNEDYQQCPECGGAMYEVSLMNEKKDACYYKVKSRYKVWPSAYASGALVKCRKKGASNWGNKSKSNEGQIYSTGGGAGQSYRYFTPKDNLGESSSILSGITQVDEGIKTKLAGAALAAAMGAFGTANAKASPTTGDEFSTPIAGWSTKTDKAGNTTDRYQAGTIDMTATRNAQGQPVHSGGTYRVNKTAAVNVDVPYKDGKKGITTTVGRADNPSDLDNIMGVDASAERKKLDPKAFAKFQQNYKVDEGLKSQLAGAALAAAMAAGGAQADNTRRVVPQADGTMSPSFAQQIANASQNLQVVKPLPNNFEQIVYKGMNGVRDKEDGTIVLIGNAPNSVQVISIENNKETTDYMDIKQLGNETKQALSLIVNKSETQPLGKPTPGVTVDNQKNTLNYNGKEYDIVKIKKNGPQPRISRFDAKVQVPYPDFGIRSLGVVNVTLAGDTAYAYLD